MQKDRLVNERIEKLKKIQDLKWNPFVSVFDKKNTISDALSSLGQSVKTAGRIFSLRTHGDITFIDIKDESGKIQLFFKRESIGEEKYINLKLLDIGDFIGVEGIVMKTIAGEISIAPSDYTLLTKSLRVLPDEWFGLKDIETRYRKRYLDLLLNPKTKSDYLIRIRVIKLLREFLDKNGFLEVETPILQPLYGGAASKPFTTHYNALDSNFYLRISVELYLKRLIVGGFEKVYEIGKNFRNEGFSRAHNPEFTMLEFYWAYADYEKLMEFTEKMLTHIIKEIKGSLQVTYQNKQYDFTMPWKRVTYKDLFLEHLKLDIDKYPSEKELSDYAHKNKLLDDPVIGYPQLMDALFKKYVRPKITGPVFVIDYPTILKPLAKKSEKDESKSASFQLVVEGVELLNAFNELNDPINQRERWEADMKVIERGGEDYQVLDEDYLEALEYGMPPTAGWGMGIDRFVSFLTDTHTIKDIILFPTMRPEHPVEEIGKKKIKKTTSSTNLILTREQAISILKNHLKNKNLINHNIAVEGAMGALAHHFNEDEPLWKMAGLLHDADWEETQAEPSKHTSLTVEWIKETGENNQELIDCILSHNYEHNGFRKPKSKMEWALYTCDELTGFIVACALVRPEKKLESVSVHSVLKKFPQKAFAAPVKREQIKLCTEKLGIPLPEFVEIVLKSMQRNSLELGL